MKKRVLVVFVFILFIGFILRFHNHTTWPRKGATFDEYAWTWLGMNIIQKGIPISWSPHPQYKTREHYIEPEGARFWLVQPYLEHPPLFGLVAGASAFLVGAKDMYSVTFDQIRILPLFLGVISVCVVFILSYELYNGYVAIISSLLYATIPTIVIGSRILQNENFFIPIYLFILYSVTRFIKLIQKKGQKPGDISNLRLIAFPAILCGLLTLAKVPWWGATLGVLFILCSEKLYSYAFIFLGIVLFFFSIFFIWGYIWDWNLFISLWKLQTARYDITFDGIFALFQQPYLVDRIYIDGWIYAGWFSLISLLSRFNEHKYLILGFLGYAVIYFLGIPNEPGHGWYRYPFYPFLVIALSYVIYDLIKQRSLLSFFIFTFIGNSLLQLTWSTSFGFSYFVYRFFIIVTGLSSITTVFHGKKFIALQKISTYFIVLFLILLNFWAIWIYNEQ